MEETSVSLETAKLAKEIGFNVECFSYYRIRHDEIQPKVGSTYSNNPNEDNPLSEHFVLAPTQSLLQKWLREEHQIYLQIVLVEQMNPNSGWGYELTYAEHEEWHNTDESEPFKSYEDALEEGLFRALKLIK